MSASPMQSTMHAYEVRPRKGKHGVDLIRRCARLPAARFHLAHSANVVRPYIVCRMREVLIPRCSQFQRFLLPNKGQAARSKAHCGSTMPDAVLPMDCPDAPRSTISFLPTRFALDRLDRPHRRDL